MQMMAAMAARPAGRISEVFKRSAERQAAYDFVEHDGVSAQAVRDAIGDACARSCAQHERVLVAIDGTSLNLTDRAQNKGFGHVGTIERGARGLKVMNTLALTPQGEVLGVPAQRYWSRHVRARRVGYLPAAERESAHWHHAIDEVAERFARLVPATRLHFLADREADASLLIRALVKRGHEFTLRANGTRVLQWGQRRVGLRPWLAQQPILARITLHLSAAVAGRARDARLSIRAARVPLVMRDRHHRRRHTCELTVVWAREEGPVGRAEQRVEWLLYTTDHVQTALEACTVVQRYGLRWRIEDMHRTWKSGACNVETMQLRSVEAATKWACMLATVAARIEQLKHRSRTSPDEPASVELNDFEIRALILLKRDEKKRTETVPDTMPTLGQAVRWIADLGGYIGSKSSGPPGTIVLSRGLERVTIAAQLLEQLQREGRLR